MNTEQDYWRLYKLYQEAISEIRRLNALIEGEEMKMSEVWKRHIDEITAIIKEVERYIEDAKNREDYDLMKQLKIHAGNLINQKANLSIAYVRCIASENSIYDWTAPSTGRE